MSKSLCSHQLFQFYFKCSSVANAHMLLNVGLLPNCLDESVIQICIDIYSRNVNGRWGVKWLIGAFTFWIFCCHSDPMIYNQPAAGREISFLFGNYKEPQNNWTCGLNIYDGNNGWEIIWTRTHTRTSPNLDWSCHLRVCFLALWLFYVTHNKSIYESSSPHKDQEKLT